MRGGWGGVGVKNVETVTPAPLFFGVRNHESFGFSILSQKSVSGSRLHGVVWGGVGRALMQFMDFSAIFALLAILVTSVTPWYPL